MYGLNGLNTIYDKICFAMPSNIFSLNLVHSVITSGNQLITSGNQLITSGNQLITSGNQDKSTPYL